LRDWIESDLDRLYGFAYALSHDSDQARDLVQDCALRAIEAARHPTDRAAYRAWLFRILRNAFIDRCRKARVEVDINAKIGVADDNAGWSGDARVVDIITVRLAVAKLPIAHREVIALVDFVGLTYSEAAVVLDIAEGTVMSRVSRARKALLAIVEEGNVTPFRRQIHARGSKQ